MVLIPEKCFVHLLGKTGTGKSSTGNTILGHKAFNCKSSTLAVTDKIQIESARVKDRKLEIVDGPGLVDVNTGLNEASIKAYKQIVDENEDAVHIFCIVWRYGDPLSSDDRSMIDALKKEFGQNVLKNHGLIAMTCGDNFRSDTEGDQSFESWCKEQKGTFSDVLEETQGRAILIENSRSKEKRDEKALDTLVHMLDGLDMESATGKSLRISKNQLGVFVTIKAIMYKYRLPIILGLVLIASVSWFLWPKPTIESGFDEAAKS